MLAKLLHVSKVLSEMLVNERGSVICVKAWQPTKAASPTTVTESGTFTFCKDTQYAKAHGSMIVSVSGRTMRASFAQPSKALAPIDVTDSGIVTVRISSQPRKASGAIFVTWDVLGCFLLCPLPPLFYCKRPSHPIPGVRGQRTPPSGHHPATVPRSGPLYSE